MELILVQTMLPSPHQRHRPAAPSQPAQTHSVFAPCQRPEASKGHWSNPHLSFPQLTQQLEERCSARWCVRPASPEDLVLQTELSGFGFMVSTCWLASMMLLQHSQYPGFCLWLFVPFCTFSNEDCAHRQTKLITSQLGLHLLVLSSIFMCRSVIAFLPYFVWSCIHKRALSFIYHHLNHLFLLLKTGLLWMIQTTNESTGKGIVWFTIKLQWDFFQALINRLLKDLKKHHQGQDLCLPIRLFNPLMKGCT